MRLHASEDALRAGFTEPRFVASDGAGLFRTLIEFGEVFRALICWRRPSIANRRTCRLFVEYEYSV